MSYSRTLTPIQAENKIRVRENLLAAFVAQGCDPVYASGFITEHVKFEGARDMDTYLVTSGELRALDEPGSLAAFAHDCADRDHTLPLRTAAFARRPRPDDNDPDFPAPVSVERAMSLRSDVAGSF